MARTTAAVLALTGIAALGLVLVLRRRRAPRADVRDRTAREWLDTRDPVDLASDLSFPASDPPAWTGTTA